MAKSKIILVTIIFLQLNTNMFAKNKTNQSLVWLRYNAQIQLPKKFLLKAETEERFFMTKNIKQHQFIYRISVDKQFPKNWNIGLGFVNFWASSNNELSNTNLVAPEWRTQLEISNQQKISDKFSIQHRYRAESRFIHNTNKEYTALESGYKHTFRFRYQIALTYIPFKKEEKELRLSVFDEILINAGKNIQNNIFDQNRVGVAVRYNFNKMFGLEMSYFNWLQQRANGTDFYNRQILRCTFYNNFTINKKDKSK
ncbi:MAG: DUF2490 domain-containing protein [Sphingobacteriales bacterium]|nr:MAG: DUF2490 domain-containing protein [Sphingobacteriales bacterium]